MTFYRDMQGVARDLLREFDQGGVVLAVSTPGAGPPHNPGASTFVDVPIHGAVRGVSAEYVDGSSVIATDLQVTIPGGVAAPKMQDRVKLATVPHQIVRIISKPATGVVAAYLVIIRK